MDPDADSRLIQILLTGKPSSAILQHLFRNRIIVLNAYIDDGLANDIMAQLLSLEAQDSAADISLYINSPGGSVTAAFAIYDTIRYIKPDVATWAIGLASGTAQMLLSAGAPGKRYALSHARILLKGMPVPVEAIEPEKKSYRDMWEATLTVTAKDTRQPVDQIIMDSHRIRWFGAQEAVDYGLVDHVVSRLKPTVRVLGGLALIFHPG